jgi:hypothetical protein
MIHKYIRAATDKQLDEVAANAVAGGGVDMTPTKKSKVGPTHRRKQFRVSSNTFKKISESSYKNGEWTRMLDLDEEQELSLYMYSRNNPGTDVEVVSEDRVKVLRRKSR